MKTISHKVSDSLYLVRQTVHKGAPAKPAEIPTNHVAIIDCSGSMSWDLPKIREQLKKKLPKLLREKDTVSLVWFSGRKEYGVLLEAEPVATLADLKDVNAAIDRWLKPVGLTGFKEPIEEIPALVKRVSKKTPGNVFSMFFMSDGCDNQWGRGEILKAVEQAAGHLASSTFVEYGYYADRPLLTAMAEKAGGTLIFSQDFDKWAPMFEAAMQKKLTGAPRIEVKVKGDTIGGFVFSLQGGDLVTYEAHAGAAHVPEDLPEVFYLSPSVIGETGTDLLSVSRNGTGSLNAEDLAALAGAYAAVSLFAVRMKSDVVFPLLKSLGDVRYIDQFSGCFGKQKYSEFMDAAKAAAFTPSERFTKGWDPKKVPRDDAFTVLELLQELSSDDDNRVLLDHSAFKYSAIGRGRLDASENLTAAEIEEIQQLTSQIAGEKDIKKLQALQLRLASITQSKGPALKFEADPAPDGYPISSLTFNEDRPNVSFLVKKAGKVDVSGRLPAELKGKVPTPFQTFVYRNYAVVKDGLVNITKLPVRLSAPAVQKLTGMVASGHVPQGVFDFGPNETIIHLDKLPVVNRKMVKATSAKAMFEKEWDLAKARAAQKVYNTYKKEHFPRKAEGFVEQYGDDAAKWLKEQGFTDYSGFGPKTVQAEAKDFYMGKELKTSLKGLSSLPSLKEAKEKIAKGKPNLGASLMAPAIKEVEDFLASNAYKGAKDKDKLFETWLDGQARTATSGVRKLIFELAQIKFSVVVGQVWFTEFKSLDENTMTIDADGQKVDCKVEMREIEIKI